MAVSPLLQSSGTTSLSVKINGLDAPSSIKFISVDVTHEAGTSAFASIKILAGGSAATGLEDYDEVKPGHTISIAAGYGNNSDEIFSGKIYGIEEEITTTNQASVIIHCTGAKDSSQSPTGLPVLGVTYGTDILEFNAKLTEAGKIAGTVNFQGSALAKTGDTIAMSNVGQTFSGKWLITRVMQHLSDGNWITTVGFAGN
jgi:phage protein D